jgi:two-component system, NtrC family, sensor histidine kinase AtoS
MTLSQPPYTPKFNNWSGKIPGFVEFNAMLNIISDPAVLLDRARNQVIAGNSAFIRLTSYAMNELSGLSLSAILADANLSQLASGEVLLCTLQKRNRDAIQVNIQVHALDATGQWLVMQITPIANPPRITLGEKDLLLGDFTDLVNIVQFTEIHPALRRAMNILTKIFESDLICFYQVDQNYPQLKKIISSELSPVFPETILSADFSQMAAPMIWSAGDTMVSEIHRCARQADLNYVASVPLGEKEAFFGLLVIAESLQSPIPQLELLLPLIAGILSNALQHFILIDSLLTENEARKKIYSIRNGLFENIQQGVLVLDADLRVMEMNPSAEIILGYTAREVQGELIDNVLIGSEGLPVALEAARNGISTHDVGTTHDAGTSSLHRRNGQSFPALIQTLPVYQEESVHGVLVFITDVSEHEQIRIRTQQLEHRAVLGEFTAIFAHEVRNPINNISTGLQLMASRLESGNPNLDVINRMMGDCSRLEHLMDSVLSFSRPVEPKIEPMDIALLLNRILDRWRPRFSKVNVKSFFQSPENLPRVYGDPRSLEQVFINLISNAVEAMSKSGGTLAVHCTTVDQPANRPHVDVSVSDNGPGIPDDIKDRIFEPFITTNPRGTGLGLAITKQIVTANRGSIHLSTFPGGTVFHVLLPVVSGD